MWGDYRVASKSSFCFRLAAGVQVGCMRPAEVDRSDASVLCITCKLHIFAGGTPQHLDGKCNAMQGTSTKKAQVPKSAQLNYAGVTSLVCITQSAYIGCLFWQHAQLKLESSFEIGTNCMPSSISM